MASYHIVLSFRTCEELLVLRCVSSAIILGYFE